MEEKYMPYRVVIKGGTGEITEKKSRFIASVSPAGTEDEALALIESAKKTYWDARHHCFAYIIGRKAQIIRYSDDGEPSGTAGRPILEVLSGLELKNTAAVVTRYFGGTLLGTGGLVRAYTRAVQAGLARSGTAMMRYGTMIQMTADYSLAGRIQSLLAQRGWSPEETVYTGDVCIRVMVPWDEKREFLRSVTEVTGGRAFLTEADSYYYIDKKQQV